MAAVSVYSGQTCIRRPWTRVLVGAGTCGICRVDDAYTHIGRILALRSITDKPAYLLFFPSSLPPLNILYKHHTKLPDLHPRSLRYFIHHALFKQHSIPVGVELVSRCRERPHSHWENQISSQGSSFQQYSCWHHLSSLFIDLHNCHYWYGAMLSYLTDSFFFFDVQPQAQKSTL